MKPLLKKGIFKLPTRASKGIFYPFGGVKLIGLILMRRTWSNQF